MGKSLTTRKGFITAIAKDELNEDILKCSFVDTADQKTYHVRFNRWGSNAEDLMSALQWGRETEISHDEFNILISSHVYFY